MSDLDSIMNSINANKTAADREALVAELTQKGVATELIAIVIKLMESTLTEKKLSNLAETVGATFPIKIAHYSSSSEDIRSGFTVSEWYQNDICLLRDGSVVINWDWHEEREGHNPFWFSEKRDSGSNGYKSLIDGIKSGLHYGLWVHEDFKKIVNRIADYEKAQANGTERNFLERIEREDAQNKQEEERKREEELRRTQAAIALSNPKPVPPLVRSNSGGAIGLDKHYEKPSYKSLRTTPSHASSTTTASITNGAAGWYKDPDDAAMFRYWDGDKWASERFSLKQWFPVEVMTEIEEKFDKDQYGTIWASIKNHTATAKNGLMLDNGILIRNKNDFLQLANEANQSYQLGKNTNAMVRLAKVVYALSTSDSINHASYNIVIDAAEAGDQAALACINYLIEHHKIFSNKKLVERYEQAASEEFYSSFLISFSNALGHDQSMTRRIKSIVNSNKRICK